MYGCLPTQAVTTDGDLGVLFMHNEGYSAMCGHGIIALVKVGLEYGLFQTKDDFVRIDTPAGASQQNRASMGEGSLPCRFAMCRRS